MRCYRRMRVLVFIETFDKADGDSWLNWLNSTACTGWSLRGRTSLSPHSRALSVLSKLLGYFCFILNFGFHQVVHLYDSNSWTVPLARGGGVYWVTSAFRGHCRRIALLVAAAAILNLSRIPALTWLSLKLLMFSFGTFLLTNGVFNIINDVEQWTLCTIGGGNCLNLSHFYNQNIISMLKSFHAYFSSLCHDSEWIMFWAGMFDFKSWPQETEFCWIYRLIKYWFCW